MIDVILEFTSGDGGMLHREVVRLPEAARDADIVRIHMSEDDDGTVATIEVVTTGDNSTFSLELRDDDATATFSATLGPYGFQTSFGVNEATLIDDVFSPS